jgi:hypothetical protein
MQWLDEHRSYLKLLASTHSKQRKAILSSSNNQQLNILCEIIHNFLNGIIPTEPEELQKFSKSRNTLRKLGQKVTKTTRSLIIKQDKLIAHFLKFILNKFES